MGLYNVHCICCIKHNDCVECGGGTGKSFIVSVTELDTRALSSTMNELAETDPDDIVWKEYRRAEQRPLSRNDEVGLAFRDALERLQKDRGNQV